MPLKSLDHVNLRTADLAGMVAWYGRVLDMTPGPRPDFPFSGAWLYAGDKAIVHLVEVDAAPEPGPDLRLEHFAITAEGLPAFLDRLRAEAVAFRPSRIEDFGVLQLNILDPDGNHIHVDFPLTEAEEVDLGD